MDRTVKTKAEFSNLTQAQKARLVDLMESRDLELVSNKEGVLASWAETETAENEFLTLAKAGNAEIVSRFPVRFTADGEPVTKDNIKDTDLATVKTASEIASVLAEKELQKEKDELVARLNAMTKAEIEKEYGVSSKLTKDKMILEVLKLVYGE